MPKSSSPSPSITPMNPSKAHPQTLTLSPTLALTPHPSVDDDTDYIFQPFHLHSQSLLLDDEDDAEHENPTCNPHSSDPSQVMDDIHPESPFSSLLLRDPDIDDEEEEDDAAHTADFERKMDGKLSSNAIISSGGLPPVDPSPHISSQFYTFNRDSHALMIRCILEGRLAAPNEIREATPRSVLKSWRLVWKDRNEDTAYLTAWKRIQDKLHAHVDDQGSPSLFFKNNPAQSVSHFEQWQDIVASFHADPDFLRHLGLKETVDRIKQLWTVGAKFYGIPESFIRDCISSCHICSSSTSIAGVSSFAGGASSRTKRRRFEYTESFDVPANEVPRRLQQLAAKHKVVLCIRQKYIRYKPFMAEVKDYTCHRAGEPTSVSGSTSTKKPRVLKREPYQSKRCGCGFRIRAIVPITNYNEKDKTFVYLEEGTAVFKLYAVHSGHEPGPLDGNARIIHRVVGHKGGLEYDPVIYGVHEDTESEAFVDLIVKEDICNIHNRVLQKIQEVKAEAGLLERKMAKMPPELLISLSRELTDTLNRFRTFTGQPFSDESLVMGDDSVAHWGSEANHDFDVHERLFGNKDSDIVEEDEADFHSTLGPMVPWGSMTVECHEQKMMMGDDNCKSDKWLLKEDCSDFDEKSILNCVEDEHSKLIKPNLSSIQVDGFYQENAKWYDSPVGLDSVSDCVDGDFRHGGLV